MLMMLTVIGRQDAAVLSAEALMAVALIMLRALTQRPVSALRVSRCATDREWMNQPEPRSRPLLNQCPVFIVPPANGSLVCLTVEYSNGPPMTSVRCSAGNWGQHRPDLLPSLYPY